MKAGIPEERRRALVVDDEPAVARATSRLLSNHWLVDTAGSAQEAVGMMRLREYDAVLTDYDMPGRDGIWLLDWVRHAFPETKRVLHSGSDVAQALRHLPPGLIQYMVRKPAEPEDFLSLITINK
jgi:CheY-like chemotaxis protein